MTTWENEIPLLVVDINTCKFHFEVSSGWFYNNIFVHYSKIHCAHSQCEVDGWHLRGKHSLPWDFGKVSAENGTPSLTITKGNLDLHEIAGRFHTLNYILEMVFSMSLSFTQMYIPLTPFLGANLNLKRSRKDLHVYLSVYLVFTGTSYEDI